MNLMYIVIMLTLHRLVIEELRHIFLQLKVTMQPSLLYEDSFQMFSCCINIRLTLRRPFCFPLTIVVHIQLKLQIDQKELKSRCCSNTMSKQQCVFMAVV